MAEYSIYNLPKLIFFCCFGTLSVVLLLIKSDKLVDSKAKTHCKEYNHSIIGAGRGKYILERDGCEKNQEKHYHRK